MAQRRWKAPPMNAAPTAAPVKLDEQVVRHVLKVNPQLRDGRTTFQVKKALERGEAMSTAKTVPAGARVEPPRPAVPVEPARQLSETLDFFMTSKGRELSGALEQIAARRRLLDEEEKRVREETRRKLVEFLLMLDPGVLAIHGKDALQAHRELLYRVGLSATELLEQVKRGQP